MAKKAKAGTKKVATAKKSTAKATVSRPAASSKAASKYDQPGAPWWKKVASPPPKYL